MSRRSGVCCWASLGRVIKSWGKIRVRKCAKLSADITVGVNCRAQEQLPDSVGLLMSIVVDIAGAREQRLRCEGKNKHDQF